MVGLKQASPLNKHCTLSHSDQNKYCPAVSAHLKIQRPVTKLKYICVLPCSKCPPQNTAACNKIKIHMW